MTMMYSEYVRSDNAREMPCRMPVGAMRRSSSSVEVTLMGGWSVVAGTWYCSVLRTSTSQPITEAIYVLYAYSTAHTFAVQYAL